MGATQGTWDQVPALPARTVLGCAQGHVHGVGVGKSRPGPWGWGGPGAWVPTTQGGALPDGFLESPPPPCLSPREESWATGVGGSPCPLVVRAKGEGSHGGVASMFSVSVHGGA